MLDTLQIKRLLRKHIHHCLGVLSIDQLPKRIPSQAFCFIANMDPAHLPGSHWIAIYVDAQQKGEVFDSYGRLPPLPLQRWMNRHCRHWTYNKRFLQGPLTTLCGVYCIYFLHMRCLRQRCMRDIVHQDFTGRFDENDAMMRQFYKSIIKRC